MFLCYNMVYENIAIKFNQPLNNWDVSNVKICMILFNKMQKNFNQPLNNWDVSNVTYMDNMLHYNV